MRPAAMPISKAPASSASRALRRMRSRAIAKSGVSLLFASLCAARSLRSAGTRKPLLVREPHAAAPAESGEILIGLEPGSSDPVRCKLFVALLGFTSDAHGANHLPVRVTNQLAAAFRKNLFAAHGREIAHKARLLLGTHPDELRRTPERERGIGFAISHLETQHGAAVLLLECLHLAAKLDHDDRKWPALELGRMREDRVNEAFSQF